MIFDRVKEIIIKEMSIDAEKIEMSTNFIEDLNADSLDLVQLLMVFEKEFKTEFEDSEISGIQTVGDAVRCLEMRKK